MTKIKRLFLSITLLVIISIGFTMAWPIEYSKAEDIALAPAVHTYDDTIQISLEESDERSDGYIEMPWENDVPKTDTKLSYNATKEMRVDDPYGFDKGRIGSETDVTIPSAWPYSYTREADLIQYFKTTLPPLRDQGSEGTCWAHSSMSLMENYLLFNHGNDLHGAVSRNATEDVPAINYSELQLAYFYYHSNTNPIISNQGGDSVIFTLTKGDNFKSVGGNLLLSAETLIKWRGAVDESLVPYSTAGNFSTDEQLRAETGLSEEMAYEYDVAHLTNAYYINIHTNSNQVKPLKSLNVYSNHHS